MSSQENALTELDAADLPERARAAMQTAGWPGLMPVQQKAIPYLFDGRDLIVQSRTGSGKTGAFLLPLFELLDPTKREVQALVLCPTRELARQIHDEFERMKPPGSPEETLHSAAIYGGMRYAPQIRDLKSAQLVIGTPGRILDHLEQRTFTLNRIRMLILDEADEMLSMGFYPAMQKLKYYLPKDRNSYMFSATMPPKVRALATDFLQEPGFLSLSAGQESVVEIDHHYHLVDPMQKDRALVRIIEVENPESAIIFANMKREVEYLATFLRNYGYDADAISGDLTQKAREAVMDRIRKGSLRFLVATDVAARGIDISDLSHVIMYGVPQDPEYYIHRSGRTARAGKTGKAIVLATYEDEGQLKSIAHRYEIEIPKLPLPEAEEVESRVAQRVTVMLEDRMRGKSNLKKERLARFVPLVKELAAEEPELLSMLVDELYHHYLHTPAPAPAPEEQTKEARPEKSGSKRSEGRKPGPKPRHE